MSTDHNTITEYFTRPSNATLLSGSVNSYTINVVTGSSFNSGFIHWVVCLSNPWLDLFAEIDLRKTQVWCENQGTKKWKLEFGKNPTDIYSSTSSL